MVGRSHVEISTLLCPLRTLAFCVALATLLASCAHGPTAGPGAGRFSSVVIDAGHGGKDNGGTSRPRAPIFLLEKDMALDTAKRVRGILQRDGLRTIMVREDDHFVDRQYRQRIAEGIAEGILEQYRLGDAGIAPVPEIWAPLSRASDKYESHSSPRPRKR